MRSSAITLLFVVACAPGVEVRHPGGLPTHYPHRPIAPRGLLVELGKLCRSPDIAWLKMTIQADGRPLGIVVTDASTESFGKNCAKMLEDAGAWQPARDAAGKAVADEISYQCECAMCDSVFCGGVQRP